MIFLRFLMTLRVHPLMAMNRGNCTNANMHTGKNAAQYVKVEVHVFPSNLILIKIVALNDSIVVAMEKNNKAKPAINFRGRDFRKSHISQGDVRIERNIITEAREPTRATISMIVKTKNMG